MPLRRSRGRAAPPRPDPTRPEPPDHPAGPATSPRRWTGAHLAPLLVAVVGLGLTGAVTALSHLNYLHNEHRVLTLEATLTRSSLAVAPVDLERRLGKAVTEASLTHGTPSLFGQIIRTSVGGTGPLLTAELFELTPTGPVRRAAVGARPVLPAHSAVLARLCRAAVKSGGLAVARIARPGLQRFAYAMAAAAPGGGPTFVAYGEQALPADRRAHLSGPSSAKGLDIALYLGRSTSRGALVESNAATPLGPPAVAGTLPFGNRVLTVVVSPAGPLMGALAADVAWILLALGLLLTAAGVWLSEWTTRRRRTAEHTASVSWSLYRDQRAVAETLQRALLPRRLPQPPGFEVAARYRAGAAGVAIGGDWYDAIVEGDTLFFSVGDVSGRGLEAAVVMAQLRHAIGAHALDGAGPAAVLGKVTRSVSLAEDGRFATVLCGSVSLTTGAVRLANAGHVLPVLLGGAGADVLEVPPDPPLGVGRAFSEHELALAPGQTLLMVTDGLVERRGEAIDAGMARLRAESRGASTLDSLLDTLLVRLAPEGAHDDIAMLAIRRAGTGPARVPGPAVDTPTPAAQTGGVRRRRTGAAHGREGGAP